MAFFQQVNPAWPRGVELACLARMTVWMPAYYAFKAAVKGRLPQLQCLFFSLPKRRHALK